MGTLGKRLVSSAFLIAITIVAIFFAPEWFFFMVVLAFSLAALNEFFLLAQKKDIVINRSLGIFFGIVLAFAVAFSAEAIVFATACLAIFIFNFHRSLRQQALISTAVTLFGIIYTCWFFLHLLKIRALPQGTFWVFYTILLVKGGDAGAYFVGKKFGKVKLIEHISPNKSIEGAWGGFFTTVILSLCSKIYLGYVPVSHLLILGIVLGVLSQLGDLAESLIKRDVGVKDSGHIPGLGGILDVLDSLILTVPFVYYYLISFNPMAR